MNLFITVPAAVLAEFQPLKLRQVGWPRPANWDHISYCLHMVLLHGLIPNYSGICRSILDKYQIHLPSYGVNLRRLNISRNKKGWGRVTEADGAYGRKGKLTGLISSQYSANHLPARLGSDNQKWLPLKMSKETILTLIWSVGHCHKRTVKRVCINQIFFLLILNELLPRLPFRSFNQPREGGVQEVTDGIWHFGQGRPSRMDTHYGKMGYPEIQLPTGLLPQGLLYYKIWSGQVSFHPIWLYRTFDN